MSQGFTNCFSKSRHEQTDEIDKLFLFSSVKATKAVNLVASMEDWLQVLLGAQIKQVYL